MIYPEDYKHGSDPQPFTFTCVIENKLITKLQGKDVTPEAALHVTTGGKIVDWLKAHPYATKTAMKKAGLGQWDAIEATLDRLTKEGKVDSGRKAGSFRYWIVGSEPSAPSVDGSSPEEPKCT